MWISQIVVAAGKVLAIGVVCAVIVAVMEWRKGPEARALLVEKGKILLALVLSASALVTFFFWPWQTLGAGALIALAIASGKDGWRDPLVWAFAVAIMVITSGNILMQGHERSIPWKQCGTGRYAYDC